MTNGPSLHGTEEVLAHGTFIANMEEVMGKWGCLGHPGCQGYLFDDTSCASPGLYFIYWLNCLYLRVCSGGIALSLSSHMALNKLLSVPESRFPPL